MTLLIGSEISLAQALYRALYADEVGNAQVRIAVARPYFCTCMGVITFNISPPMATRVYKLNA